MLVVSAAGTPAASSPALAAITASADSGTPASTAQASSNVAQTIELTGTGLTAATGIIFATRDNYGTVGTVTVYARAVNDTGARMQVVVPDLAQTGNVTLAGGTGSVLLQVVPTLTGMSGLPGTDSAVTVYGSGFMNAAQTITIGGLNRINQYTNQGDPTISGPRNDTLSGIVMPTAVESIIRVTTAGGYAELTIPAASLPPFVEFNALNAAAATGTAANPAVASAGRAVDRPVEVQQRDAGAVRGGGPDGGSRRGHPHRCGIGRRHVADGGGAGAGGKRRAARGGSVGVV